MDTLELVFPGLQDEAEVMDYVAEHRAHGEEHLNGSAGLHNSGSYGDWLARRVLEREGRAVDPEWGVPGLTYLARRRPDGLLVGMVNVRQGDSPKILDFDGHIGCGVRPTQRRRGYATALLRLALARCRALGFAQVLVTCDHGNTASEGAIRRAGGVFEDARQEPCGNWVHRFWFDLESGENG